MSAKAYAMPLRSRPACDAALLRFAYGLLLRSFDAGSARPTFEVIAAWFPTDASEPTIVR